MNSLKQIFASLALLAAGVQAYAQGGDDCASAMANPTTIPFTGPGNTCNGADDYNMNNINPNTTCTSTWYMTGQDWLYYFTATQTGNLQIMLSNMNPQPWGSISVWDNCPTTGNCIGGTANWSTTLSVIVPVVQGQSYFIMIDCYPTPNCFSYDIDISYIQPPTPQPSCTNMDFETANFNGWYGTQCQGMITVGQPNDPTPVYNMTAVGIVPPQHTIMTGGTDMCGGFPCVYPGGNYSVRLGDSIGTGSNGCQLIQTFAVTAANASFTYHYAAVIQDATHLPNEQPFFKIDMFDQNGDTIQCAKYLVVGGPNIPGFFASSNPSCFQTYYRPWTTVNVDLTAFVNQNVTIQFTVGDCCYGGHFAYAYVDCSCSPYVLQSSVDTICQGQTAQLVAPPGSGSYSWVPGGQTTQSINVNTAGIYTVWMTSLANPNCLSAITDTVNVFPVPTAGFTYVAAGNCGGDTISFTNTSGIPSGTLTYSWAFGDNTSSTQQDPIHFYNAAGTYTVTLYVYSTPNGCSDTIQQVISLGAGVQAAFGVNTPACLGSPQNFTDQSTGGASSWLWDFGDASPQVNTQNATHTYAAPGTYTVTLIVASGPNCIDTMQQQVVVAPIPVPLFTSPDTNGCITLCVDFNDLSTIGAPDNITAWSWNFGDPGSGPGNTSTSQNPQHCYQTAGTFDVSLTVTSNNGCVATYVNNAYVVAYPLPVADFTMNPNPTTVLDPIVALTDISSGNPVTWTWTYSDGPATDYTQNTSHTFPTDNSGIHYYTVNLLITDANGCSSMVSKMVEIDPEFTFYVPNAFTPNGDGNNELFFTYGVGIKNFSIWIFDRWGNKIWWAEKMDEGWDGKVKGGNSNAIVQEDVYVWKVVLTDVFDKKHTYVGHVSVIK
jgi:gliding motility-associated-like protein